MWIKIHPASELESLQERRRVESIDAHRDLMRPTVLHGSHGGLVAVTTALRVTRSHRTAP
ncbi:hypothetical protein [Methanothrix soehngenii]|uniref:hypothetical protein n=1 Tax=Methanothrix soehngenii TaxID=2223 RepID=UPI002FDF0EBC